MNDRFRIEGYHFFNRSEGPLPAHSYQVCFRPKPAFRVQLNCKVVISRKQTLLNNRVSLVFQIVLWRCLCRSLQTRQWLLIKRRVRSETQWSSHLLLSFGLINWPKIWLYNRCYLRNSTGLCKSSSLRSSTHDPNHNQHSELLCYQNCRWCDFPWIQKR